MDEPPLRTAHANRRLGVPGGAARFELAPLRSAPAWVTGTVEAAVAGIAAGLRSTPQGWRGSKWLPLGFRGLPVIAAQKPGLEAKGPWPVPKGTAGGSGVEAKVLVHAQQDRGAIAPWQRAR